ncbi:MAG: flippase-like domain-containing protein [Phycisphaerae bacterium]|jgi:uncharacterized protein (TIRG00374 family)|nr:flippase-like domain-containing protein [Phycisphaerae bacterium]
MNEMTTEENFRPRHSRLIMAGRILFAVAALAMVIHSIQFHDYLAKDEQRYPVVADQPDRYLIRDAAGQERVVLKSDTTWKYRIGAITLAKNIRVGPAMAALGLFALVPILLTYRWRQLLRAQQIDLSFKTAAQLTYAGLFLNFFLIGTTGGDLVKAYWLGRFSPKRAEGFVSVFVDRFIGLIVLIFLAAVLVIFMWRDPQVAKISRAIGILVILAASAILVLFSRRIRRLIRFDRWKSKLPIAGMIDRIDRSLLAYRQSPRLFLTAIGATVVLQILSSIASYFLGIAIQIDAGIWYYMLYVPLAFLIGSIPVSVFWGLGLLEGAYVGFFAGSGFATVTQAAMLAMAVRLMQMFWSLPGSLVMATGLQKNEKNLATNDTP